MTEDLDPGKLAVDQKPAPATTPVPAAADDDAALEAELQGQTVDQRGEKFVPLAALKESRAEKKALAAKLKELEDKTKDHDQLADYVKKAQPWISKLEARPDLVEALTKPSKDGEVDKDDPEAKALAEDLQLYDAAGELDVRRAQRVIQRMEARAEKIADKKVGERVAPIESGTREERAASLRQRAYNSKDPETGLSYAKREAIDKVLDQLPAELTSQPEVVRLALVIARGLSGAPTEEREPVLSEAPGGRRLKSAPLSTIEEAAAKARGMTTEQWRSTRDKEGDVLE